MASTKALLREFGKQSASLAFPQNTDTAIALDWKANDFAEYIPPSDGWLFVRGQGTSGISAEVVCDGVFGVLSSKEDGLWGSCVYQVKKGQVVYYAIFGVVTAYWIRFVPAKLSG